MNETNETSGSYEPKIIGFLCNWCSYAGADLAGASRLKYPPNLRIIRVPCSGRISPELVLRTFREGADGVMVEVHSHPEDALVDGPQSISTDEFSKLMSDLRRLAPAVDRDV